MNDVARSAGVGTMTVSRVLNHSPHVSQETAERVRAAVDRLGYQPNEMARALRNSKSRTIGILLPNLYDHFYAVCAHALNMVAKEHDYTVLLTITNDDSEHEYIEARRMLQRHVEGLIVIPANPDLCKLGKDEFRGVPVVTLDRPLPRAGGFQVDSVVTENRTGACLATEHLIRVHKLKRILLLGHKPGLYTMVHRCAGYEDAMLAANLKPSASFACNSEAAAVEIISAAMARRHPPQALFSANNLTTRHILTALPRLKLRVPEDIALVSFDDLELGGLLHPALTVVQQQVERLGETAARILFSRMKNQALSEAGSQHTLPVELIIRHSCGCTYEQDWPV